MVDRWRIYITRIKRLLSIEEIATESFSKVDQNKNAMSEENLPEGFALAQNYPNPFNPTTNITYSIPDGNFVTLKVYDMLGREVAVLVNENKPAGQYTIEFNASNLPSGTYVYKLTAGSYNVVKKMSLVK